MTFDLALFCWCTLYRLHPGLRDGWQQQLWPQSLHPRTEQPTSEVSFISLVSYLQLLVFIGVLWEILLNRCVFVWKWTADFHDRRLGCYIPDMAASGPAGPQWVPHQLIVSVTKHNRRLCFFAICFFFFSPLRLGYIPTYGINLLLMLEISPSLECNSGTFWL